jgi:branched-chain amino acid transport system ATP-binding protein
MLKINNISAGYGDLKVLFNVTVNVDEGESVALLGANGAGKTTLLQIISGLVKITAGTINWYDKDLLKLSAGNRADLGIAHIPQGRGILGSLSVMDNLILGTYSKRVKGNRKKNIEMAFEMFPRLKERKTQIAGSLSGGEQQMLSIGRALCMEPKLLILDEPSLGLAPIIVSEVFSIIKRIKKEGVAILIIEQNIVHALNVCDRGYVIENGHIIIEGTSDEIRNTEDVKKAYMGI